MLEAIQERGILLLFASSTAVCGGYLLWRGQMNAKRILSLLMVEQEKCIGSILQFLLLAIVQSLGSPFLFFLSIVLPYTGVFG